MGERLDPRSIARKVLGLGERVQAEKWTRGAATPRFAKRMWDAVFHPDGDPVGYFGRHAEDADFVALAAPGSLALAREVLRLTEALERKNVVVLAMAGGSVSDDSKPPHPLKYTENDTDRGRVCAVCGFPVPGGYSHTHAAWCQIRYPRRALAPLQTPEDNDG